MFTYLLHACYMRTCVSMCVHVEAGVNVRYIPYHSPVYGFGIGSFFDFELISCLEWSANELQGSKPRGFYPTVASMYLASCMWS